MQGSRNGDAIIWLFVNISVEVLFYLFFPIVIIYFDVMFLNSIVVCFDNITTILLTGLESVICLITHSILDLFFCYTFKFCVITFLEALYIKK